MNPSARRELESIKSELQSIINELDRISTGIRNDFRGIGNESCASCISKVANQYRQAKRRLDNINTSQIVEGFGRSSTESY